MLTTDDNIMMLMISNDAARDVCAARGCWYSGV